MIVFVPVSINDDFYCTQFFQVCFFSNPKDFKRLKSCIVCYFWSFNFRNKFSIFQEYSKNTQIQVNILPFS